MMTNQSKKYLTIKELTTAVGGGVTARMVRHYHQLGLMPIPERSPTNYRLYTEADVSRLKQIVALKQQGFQLSHIHQLLKTETNPLEKLRQHYQSVQQKIVQLRRTAIALEGLLGRDHCCRISQGEALAQLKLLEVETETKISALTDFWHNLDANTDAHPEVFEESLQQILPDLSGRSEIEVDLLSKLVLACGDVSLVPFVRLSPEGIHSVRNALKSGVTVVGDVPTVVAAFEQTRLVHLGCPIVTLIDDPHISSASEAEQAFWQDRVWQKRLAELPRDCILVIGYAPSILMSACAAIAEGKLKPSFVIGMPIGFSHAPAAKRRLALSPIPHLTIEGTWGGGLLAAVALNVFVESLLAKPECHCYLRTLTPESGQS